MTSEWTAAQRAEFIRICSLDGTWDRFPKVIAPRPVVKPPEGRLRREMAPGMYPDDEPPMPRRLFGLCANIDERGRPFVECLRKKHFLTTENRNRLERVWISSAGWIAPMQQPNNAIDVDLDFELPLTSAAHRMAEAKDMLTIFGRTMTTVLSFTTAAPMFLATWLSFRGHDIKWLWNARKSLRTSAVCWSVKKAYLKMKWPPRWGRDGRDDDDR